MNQHEKVLHALQQGTVQVIPQAELQTKLQRGKPLIVKLGMDPTAPDLHLGHAVVLKKLKVFQKLGHKIILIIGDFTARIGDPTGRSKTRPALTDTEIQHNASTYLQQVGTILDLDNVEIHYNSAWLDALTPYQWIKLCASVTLSRVIEREDFAQRMADHQPIGFHELLYPLMQAYDSVMLHADVELGGTDQTFNLLMGRHLQEHYGQEPQVIMTMPLLEGIDGSKKMSKSLGNAIGLTEPADQAFGKLMSISDTLMWHYARLLLDMNDSVINNAQNQISAGTLHPMDYKKNIAHDIITTFWSPDAADQAQRQFEALFQKKDYSQAQIVHVPSHIANPIWIVELLKILQAISSSSEARRLIESGAVIINGDVISDFKAEIRWQSNMVIKVGKHRIYRIG